MSRFTTAQVAEALAGFAGSIPLSEYVRRVYPDGWTIVDRYSDGYRLLERSGLRIIVGTAEHEDGRTWMHVSLSRADRVPSYNDMKYVKEVVIGDRWAIQIFPPADQHVNIHQFCLHLWVPLTGSLPWPNFGEGGTI